jgi:hypothetical protein
MDKKLVYQIEITLCTDGDFSFRKELLPPDFLTDDCREIIELTEDSFKCNIYTKDMSEFGWKNNDWCKFIARSTFESYISAIHVSHTHLYIWKDLLSCVDSVTSWLYAPEDSPSLVVSLLGNYFGTKFSIRKVSE